MRTTFIVIFVLSVALFTAACSGAAEQATKPASAAGLSASPKPSPEPQTVDAAKTAAQRSYTAYAAGDWAAVWDQYTAQGKAAISRSEYVRLLTTCPGAQGLSFTVTGARLESPTVAIVTYQRLMYNGKSELHYEDRVWRYQPDAGSLADYAKGVDKVVAERKAEGSCKV